MSGKLDQSLDEILSSRRGVVGRRRSQRRPAGRPATTTPVGGVQKTAKNTRAAAAKSAPAKATGGSGESKIIISNLPKDVSEAQIKEYFANAIGPIKKAEISYGPNSQSRGIANVTFSRPGLAHKACQSLNGLLLDNRPIKIEIVVGSAEAEKIIPPVKSLADRVSQPKAQPKSAAADKHNSTAAKAAAVGRKKGRRVRNARPAKKTKDELDAEMADYFDGSSGNAENANGGAPTAATNGDAQMVDEIM